MKEILKQKQKWSRQESKLIITWLHNLSRSLAFFLKKNFHISILINTVLRREKKVDESKLESTVQMPHGNLTLYLKAEMIPWI